MTSADKFGIAFSIGFTVALVAFAAAFSNASTSTQPAVTATPVKPTTSTPPPTPAPAAAPTPTPKPAEEKPVVEEKMATEEKPAMEKMPAMEEKPAEKTKAAPMKVAVSIASGASTPGCEDNNECFQPDTATVGVGGTVTWTNDDTAAHTVTSGTATDGPDGTFDSSIIMAGKTFSNTFDEAGTYDYFCVVHPWMTGKVVVE